MAIIVARGGLSARSGATVAVLSGLAYGAVLSLLAGVLVALVSGAPARPAVGAGARAGLLAAIVLETRPQPARGARSALVPASVAGLSLLAATLAQPFGLPLTVAPLWQAVFLVALSWVTGAALAATVGDAPWGHVNRYDFELLLVRLANGIGWIFFGVFVALPFYVMVMTSFKSQAELLADPLDFSIDISRGWDLFESYHRLFTEFAFGTYMLNSIIVSLATVFLTLAFAVPGAYAVSRLRFRGRDVFARSILLIYMLPAIVLVLPLYAIFSQLGLRNTLLGLLVVYPATTIPVALYMLQGYFRGLPAEMEEAGLMDGLSRARVIWKITLPLSLPALATVALYVFMIAWNEFLFAFMFLDDPNIFTLPRGVASLNSSELPRELMMAGAVVSTLPVMALFLWLERYLVSGLAAGAVKG